MRMRSLPLLLFCCRCYDAMVAMPIGSCTPPPHVLFALPIMFYACKSRAGGASSAGEAGPQHEARAVIQRAGSSSPQR